MSFAKVTLTKATSLPICLICLKSQLKMGTETARGERKEGKIKTLFLTGWSPSALQLEIKWFHLQKVAWKHLNRFISFLHASLKKGVLSQARYQSKLERLALYQIITLWQRRSYAAAFKMTISPVWLWIWCRSWFENELHGKKKEEKKENRVNESMQLDSLEMPAQLCPNLLAAI